MDTNHFLILHGNIRSSNQKFVNFKRFPVDFKFSFKIMFIWNLDNCWQQYEYRSIRSQRQEFLKILESSQENTCVGWPATLLKRDSNIGIFPWILQNF